MNYSLVVTLLIPEQHAASVELAAQLAGLGTCCFAVRLMAGDGQPWRGCQAGAAPEFLDLLRNPPPDVAQAADALAELRVLALPLEPDPQVAASICWQQALAAAGLVPLAV